MWDVCSGLPEGYVVIPIWLLTLLIAIPVLLFMIIIYLVIDKLRQANGNELLTTDIELIETARNDEQERKDFRNFVSNGVFDQKRYLENFYTVVHPNSISQLVCRLKSIIPNALVKDYDKSVQNLVNNLRNNVLIPHTKLLTIIATMDPLLSRATDYKDVTRLFINALLWPVKDNGLEHVENATKEMWEAFLELGRENVRQRRDWADNATAGDYPKRLYNIHRFTNALHGILLELTYFIRSNHPNGVLWVPGNKEQFPNKIVPLDLNVSVKEMLDRLGEPRCRQYFDYDHFLLEFDYQTKTARWVFEFIRPDDDAFEDTERLDKFFEDPNVEEMFKKSSSDFSNTGYDQGHLAPAGNYSNQKRMDATFVLTNIAAQWPSLNQNPWRQLESSIRKEAAKMAGVAILIGVAFVPGFKSNLTKNKKLAIPTHFYKAILYYTKNKTIEFDGFVALNAEETKDIISCRRNRKQMEMFLGMKIFENIKDKDMTVRQMCHPLYK